MGALSEWLQIMLGEISRKQEEASLDVAEKQRREAAPLPTPPPDTPRTE